MKTRMCNSSALEKQEFLKKWIKGLNIYSNSFKKEMSILERKKAIKLSADVAIASTRNGSTHWSRALLADASKQILGRKKKEDSINTCIMSKKILRRSRMARRRRTAVGVVPQSKSSSIAKKLVKNRTRVLKSLVPGGEELDEVSLIKETLDYIVSLRVQVDVMRLLASFAERLEPTPKS